MNEDAAVSLVPTVHFAPHRFDAQPEHVSDANAELLLVAIVCLAAMWGRAVYRVVRLVHKKGVPVHL